MRRIFRYLEATFFSGLIDDPCLVIRDRPIHQSIMIDCGALQHIAKREMKPVRAIFVSHAHMDHFMGFDAFVRQTHAGPRTVKLFGPPGFADRVEARLSGYDWNLAEPSWCTFVVHEVHDDKITSSSFSGPDKFKRVVIGEEAREGRRIYSWNHVDVAAELLDHGIPVLSFKVCETKLFAIDSGKMLAHRLVAGGWLAELKRQFFTGWPATGRLTVPVQLEDGSVVDGQFDARSLYEALSEEQAPGSVGYLTDVGFTPVNISRIVNFLGGTDLLVGECAFLRDHVHKARTSNHLSTKDWNLLLRILKPRYFLPMHLSKTYLGRAGELYQELELPPETTLLRLPDHLTPRPILAREAKRLGLPVE